MNAVQIQTRTVFICTSPSLMGGFMNMRLTETVSLHKFHNIDYLQMSSQTHK